MAELQPFERNFESMIKVKFTRNIQQSGIDTLLRIWKEATGHERIGFRNGCSSCMAHLLEDIGIPYFEQKAEMAAMVAETPVEEQTPVKTVKTAPKKKTASKPKKKAK